MNRKHLKALKRKKKLQQRKERSKLRNERRLTVKKGLLTLYHFTDRLHIESIKKYGLVLGDVITDNHTGFNAVNLTEQDYFHNPAHIQEGGLKKNDIRITVQIDTDDKKLVSMIDLFKEFPNAKKVHQIAFKGSESGDSLRHWIYKGQIKTEDFLKVDIWNGTEYLETDLDRLKFDKRLLKGYKPINAPRFYGNYLYDFSGLAKEVVKEKDYDDLLDEVWNIVDAINECLYEENLPMHKNKFHEEWGKLGQRYFALGEGELNELLFKGFELVIRKQISSANPKQRTSEFDFLMDYFMEESNISIENLPVVRQLRNVESAS